MKKERLTLFVSGDHPIGAKFKLEVLGREFEGDSPHRGEMSAKLTEGTAAVGGTFFQKGFPQ
jgi:hypothetical protein